MTWECRVERAAIATTVLCIVVGSVLVYAGLRGGFLVSAVGAISGGLALVLQHRRFRHEDAQLPPIRTDPGSVKARDLGCICDPQEPLVHDGRPAFRVEPHCPVHGLAELKAYIEEPNP